MRVGNNRCTLADKGKNARKKRRHQPGQRINDDEVLVVRLLISVRTLISIFLDGSSLKVLYMYMTFLPI